MTKLTTLIFATAILTAATACGATDVLYVADSGFPSGIKYYDSDETGTYLGIYGETASQLDEPMSILFDDTGIMYVVDYNAAAVKMFDNDDTGTYLGVFGETGDNLGFPTDAAWLPNGHLLVSDDDFPALIKEFSDTGMFLRGIGSLDAVSDIAVNGNNVYVVDWINFEVHTFDASETNPAVTELTLISNNTGDPGSIAFKPDTNLLFILDNSTKKLHAYDGDTIIVVDSVSDTLNNPRNICFGNNNNLYISDLDGNWGIKEFAFNAGLVTSNASIITAAISKPDNSDTQVTIEIAGDPGRYKLYYASGFDSPSQGWQHLATVQITSDTAQYTDQLDTGVRRRFYMAEAQADTGVIFLAILKTDNSDTQAVVELTGDPGAYDIFYASDLGAQSSSWQHLTTVQNTSGTVQFTDQFDTGTRRRYYKAAAREPGLEISLSYLGIYGQTGDGDLSSPEYFNFN